MLRRSVNYAVKRAIGLLGPERVWRLHETTGLPYLKERAWSWLLSNEMRLPSGLRRKFTTAKWSSPWFVREWFSKPVHVIHAEVWARLWVMLQALIASDPDIVALDDYGCGNGLFIRTSPLVLSKLAVFRGWEFSDAAMTLLRDRYRKLDPRVSFHKTNPKDLVAMPERALVTTVGVLVYMQEAELREWLSTIAAAQTKKTVVIAEPTAFGMDRNPTSTERWLDTYNHSFVQVIEDAGLKIIATDIVDNFGDQPWVIIAAQVP